MSKQTKPMLPIRVAPFMVELVNAEARIQKIPKSDQKSRNELMMTFHEDMMESFFPSEDLNNGLRQNPTPDMSSKTYEPISRALEAAVFGNRITGIERKKMARQLRTAIDMIVDVYIQAKLGLKIRGPEAVFAYKDSKGLTKEIRANNKKLVDFNRLKRVGAYSFITNMIKPFFLPSGEQYEEMVLNAAKTLGAQQDWNSSSFRAKFVEVINLWFGREIKKTNLLPPGQS